MSTLIFQRSGWSLQISRTSKTLAVSFTTALPRKPQHLAREAYSNVHSPRRHESKGAAFSSRSTKYDKARSLFTSTRLHQEQQAQRQAATVSLLPSYAQALFYTSSYLQQPQNPAESGPLPDLTSGLDDQPVLLDEGARQVDWTRSFHGLSSHSFPKEASDILLSPLSEDDIEVKPDGIIYLPEIKYRRILNRAFGPGGWGLAPRGETIVTSKAVTREYALVVQGR